MGLPPPALVTGDMRAPGRPVCPRGAGPCSSSGAHGIRPEPRAAAGVGWSKGSSPHKRGAEEAEEGLAWG